VFSLLLVESSKEFALCFFKLLLLPLDEGKVKVGDLTVAAREATSLSTTITLKVKRCAKYLNVVEHKFSQDIDND
jgi:hypothetical protein